MLCFGRNEKSFEKRKKVEFYQSFQNFKILNIDYKMGTQTDWKYTT
jgi:hypothetical protein